MDKFKPGDMVLILEPYEVSGMVIGIEDIHSTDYPLYRVLLHYGLPNDDNTRPTVLNCRDFQLTKLIDCGGDVHLKMFCKELGFAVGNHEHWEIPKCLITP